MRFAIRDDDTNYFTSPSGLEKCYSDIWDTVPVTLFLISKVKGDWKKWVHQIYQTKHSTDWKAWDADNKAYPIENNTLLVQFLKGKMAEGKLDIGFHAKHHRNADERLPEQVNNNYTRGAEFLTNLDQTQLITDEVNFLNQVFNSNITVFTPPQNLLSKKGYQSVINAGLNICGGGIPMYKKEKTFTGLASLLKQVIFRMNNKGVDYPYVLNFSTHTEIPYHYPLQPSTRVEDLIKRFENVKKFDGDFVLSTHYIEFDYAMEYDKSKTMKMILLEFLQYVKTHNNVNFVTMSSLLEK